MIPLMKATFTNELETKKELAEFIIRANQLSMGETCLRFEQGFDLVIANRMMKGARLK